MGHNQTSHGKAGHEGNVDNGEVLYSSGFLVANLVAQVITKPMLTESIIGHFHFLATVIDQDGIVVD